MTTTAHGARRVWGGASLAANVSPGYEPRVSLHRLLHPQMYKEKKAVDESMAGRIAPWLREHGPATAKEIAGGVSAIDASSVNEQFRFGRVPGAVVVGLRKTGRRNSRVWGLQDIHTTGKTE